MKKILILIAFFSCMLLPVSATEYRPPEVPESGRDLMPVETESFQDGLWNLLHDAAELLIPELKKAMKSCLALIAIVLLLSFVRLTPGIGSTVAPWMGGLCGSGVLMHSTGVLIRLASDTVSDLSEYMKLLLPVLTGALAAQGGSTTAGALYAGTMVFDAILITLISKIIVPLIYFYICFSLWVRVTAQPLTLQITGFLKSITTWSMKTILYVFFGYISITGVVSGSVDATALKATKLAISGAVPVVGGILSDASESVLVGASLMKNSVGVYGVFALLSVWLSPFIKIGAQYLVLKLTHGICGLFPEKETVELIGDYTSAMGMLLAMTGCVCVMFLVSVICFMKGVG